MLGSFAPARLAALSFSVAIRPGWVTLLTLGLAFNLGCLMAGDDPLVFVSGAGQDAEIYLLDPGSGETTRLTNNQFPDINPQWSPDGESVVYTSLKGEVQSINLMDQKGASYRRLTDNASSDSSPLWAPRKGDQNVLAFVSEREEEGKKVTEIYSVNVENDKLSRVTFNSTADRLGDWSPDGEWIVFYSEDSQEERGLWLRNPLGVNLLRLTERHDSQPAWSPDGSYIAFVRQDDNSSSIYVLRKAKDGGWDGEVEEERLTSNEFDDYHPVWSPDSKTLAFISRRDENPEIYTMRADGADQRRLTSNSSDDLAPVWSPDGRRIAFVTYLYGSAEIMVMDADGARQRRLTNNTFDDTAPDW